MFFPFWNWPTPNGTSAGQRECDRRDRLFGGDLLEHRHVLRLLPLSFLRARPLRRLEARAPLGLFVQPLAQGRFRVDEEVDRLGGEAQRVRLVLRVVDEELLEDGARLLSLSFRQEHGGQIHARLGDERGIVQGPVHRVEHRAEALFGVVVLMSDVRSAYFVELALFVGARDPAREDQHEHERGKRAHRR